MLLQPFLDIIVDAEASGPITAAALGAVSRLLHSPMLTHFHPAAAQHALHCAVAALTMCKFEATNPVHDQIVLGKILTTLEACVAGPTGRLVTDTDVCAIYQAVYRIGFDTQVVAELSGALPLPPPSKLCIAFSELAARLCCKHAPHRSRPADLLVDIVKDTLTRITRIVFSTIPSEPPPQPPTPPSASAALSAAAAESGTIPAGRAASGALNGRTNAGVSGARAPENEGLPGEVEGYSASCADSILQFLIKLIQIEPLLGFALDLLQEAISCAGAALPTSTTLLSRLQVDFIAACLQVRFWPWIELGWQPEDLQHCSTTHSALVGCVWLQGNGALSRHDVRGGRLCV